LVPVRGSSLADLQGGNRSQSSRTSHLHHHPQLDRCCRCSDGNRSGARCMTIRRRRCASCAAGSLIAAQRCLRG
jgi:hypothetical protein